MSGETLKGFNTAQYVQGFDACTREVTDCLQSQNVTMSPELYAGLLSHLATCRRRLLLAKSRDDRHTTVLPPSECLRLCFDSVDENTSHAQTTKSERQMRAVNDGEIRSPLMSIANVHPVDLSAAEVNVKTKSRFSCSNIDTDERTVERLVEQSRAISVTTSLQSVIHRSQRAQSSTSRDVMGESDCDNVLSLATDDDVTSLMWRPW